jgi:TolB-like protein/thioredoxin-like negative regulator of GroEL
MAVLVCLAAHAPDPVLKEKLLQEVWPDTFVGEGVLVRSIFELRRVFEDEAKEPHVIQTIAKRGYRLVAPVQPLPVELDSSTRYRRWRPRIWGGLASGLALLAMVVGFNSARFKQLLPGKSTTLPIHSLAVLPLQNIGSDKRTDFLRLAVPDELVTTLSYIPSLTIRPFAITRKYQDADLDPQRAGRELRVARIITGHYLQDGDQLRVTVEAIDVESDQLLWRDTVSGNTRDVIGLQQEITQRVRQGLVPILGAYTGTVASGTQPRNVEAYELYLRTLAISRDPNPNMQAIAMLERSLQLDGDYAPAWAAVGDRHYTDAIYSNGGDAAYARSVDAFQRALALDPNLVDAAASLIRRHVEQGKLDIAYDEAEALVRRRPEDPVAHFTLSYVYRYAGLLEEAARECDANMIVDPGSASLTSCAVTFIGLGRYDRAREYLRAGESTAWVASAMLDIALRQGNPEVLREALQNLSRDQLWGRDMLEACVAHRPASEIDELAKPSEASALDHRDPELPYWSAAYSLYCGRTEAALRLLRLAVEHNYCAYPMLDHDPALAALRGAPQFGPIRAKAIECQKRFLAHRARQNPNKLIRQSLAPSGARLRWSVSAMGARLMWITPK